MKRILYNSLGYKEKRPDNHHRQDLPAKNEDTDQNATTAAVKDIQKTLPQLLQSLKPNFPTILVQSILQNYCNCAIGVNYILVFGRVQLAKKVRFVNYLIVINQKFHLAVFNERHCLAWLAYLIEQGSSPVPPTIKIG